ncbi:MAG: tetratricopeptide repeat protein [Phycisphaeraceae bacterium]
MSHFKRVCVAGLLLSLMYVAAANGAAPVPLTEKQVTDFARQLANSLNAKQPDILAASVDAQALFDQSTKGMEMTAEFRAGLWEGLKNINQQFGDQIVKQLRDGAGHYRFVHARQIGGQWKVLFRMTSKGGLNYHNMHLSAGKDGKIRIADMDVAFMGEAMTQTLRRRLLPSVASANRSVLQRLIGSESAYVTHLTDIGNMERAAAQGKFDEALKHYQALPVVLQRDQALMAMGAVYAQRMNNMDLYLQLLQNYTKLFPKAANADLMSIDAYFLQKQWDKVLAAVDRLDKKLGGDPYLDLYRANVAIQKNESDKAAKLLEKVVVSDPSMPDAYYSLIDLAMAGKQWDQVTRWVVAVRKDAGMTFGDMTQNPLFAEYVKTDAYPQCVRQLAEIEKQAQPAP